MPSPTQLRGSQQEALAEQALVRAGYRMIDRNWRGGGGELDRIAWDGPLLCFIEIRSRLGAQHGSPLETVRGSKQGRVVRAAIAFLVEHFQPGQVPMVRFDVVSVVSAASEPGNAGIEIVKNAFQPSGRLGCLGL